MRKQYSCDLLLGDGISSSQPTAEEFARLCREWAAKPGRAGATNLAALPQDFDLSKERQTIDLGAKANLTVLSLDDDEYTCFGVRLSHPDSLDESSVWSTDVCFSRSKKNSLAKASVTTTVARVSDVVRPMFVQPSRPAIVKTIVERWSAREELPVRTTASVLTIASLPKFIDLLKSDKRRLPILLISAKNLDDKPIVVADEVAEQVVGLCHVFVSENRFPSLSLRDHIGQYLNCWDGAIRIYWPGFTMYDEPYWHRLWTPDRVRELEQDKGGFKQHILGIVARVAGARQSQGDVTWSFIEGRIHQRALSELRDMGDIDKLFDEATTRIEALEQDKTNLQDQLTEAREAQERAKNEADAYRLAYIEAKKASAGKSSDASAFETLPPTTVEEVVQRIEQEFPKQIVFALNGRSEIADNPFEDCESLYAAMRFLATTLHRARSGKEPCADLDSACRESSGFFYEPHQSKVTMGMYSEYYTTTYKGKQIELKQHIGKGTSKEARYCIRVGFDYLDAEKVFVIGFVGQHQKTRAT